MCLRVHTSAGAFLFVKIAIILMLGYHIYEFFKILAFAANKIVQHRLLELVFCHGNQHRAYGRGHEILFQQIDVSALVGAENYLTAIQNIIYSHDVVAEAIVFFSHMVVMGVKYHKQPPRGVFSHHCRGDKVGGA